MFSEPRLGFVAIPHASDGCWPSLVAPTIAMTQTQNTPVRQSRLARTTPQCLRIVAGLEFNSQQHVRNHEHRTQLPESSALPRQSKERSAWSGDGSPHVHHCRISTVGPLRQNHLGPVQAPGFLLKSLVSVGFLLGGAPS